jgi:hypothetical protein
MARSGTRAAAYGHRHAAATRITTGRRRFGLAGHQRQGAQKKELFSTHHGHQRRSAGSRETG